MLWSNVFKIKINHLLKNIIINASLSCRLPGALVLLDLCNGVRHGEWRVVESELVHLRQVGDHVVLAQNLVHAVDLLELVVVVLHLSAALFFAGL